MYSNFPRRTTLQRSDYTSILDEAEKTGKPYTAEVPPEDFARLTHQLRYQAAKMGLRIKVTTDKQKGTVTVRCARLSV
jgi:hypothetical protein